MVPPGVYVHKRKAYVIVEPVLNVDPPLSGPGVKNPAFVSYIHLHGIPENVAAEVHPRSPSFVPLLSCTNAPRPHIPWHYLRAAPAQPPVVARVVLPKEDSSRNRVRHPETPVNVVVTKPQAGEAQNILVNVDSQPESVLAVVLKHITQISVAVPLMVVNTPEADILVQIETEAAPERCRIQANDIAVIEQAVEVRNRGIVAKRGMDTDVKNELFSGLKLQTTRKRPAFVLTIATGHHGGRNVTGGEHRKITKGKISGEA